MLPHVIFSSYGNDSVALIQWASEQGLEDVTVLYSDTKWSAKNWPDRVERMEGWARSLGFKTARTTSMGFVNLAHSRSGFPRQGIQFCTSELKIAPAMAWLDAQDPLGLIVCMVGVRRAESANRRSFPERTMLSPSHGGRACWAPLVDLSDEDRNALIRRAGFDPLPHRSMECFPCINSNRNDILLLAEDEARVEEIAFLEDLMGTTSKGKPRTLFRPTRHMGATGIKEVVRWAKSERGQFSLDDGTGSDCEGGFCGV
jgi:3'-phosphoadenosine 5'-phosphosulfate sulfotransferase (PAPS reductase)/FAD synthetase